MTPFFPQQRSMITAHLTLAENELWPAWEINQWTRQRDNSFTLVFICNGRAIYADMGFSPEVLGPLQGSLLWACGLRGKVQEQPRRRDSFISLANWGGEWWSGRIKVWSMEWKMNAWSEKSNIDKQKWGWATLRAFDGHGYALAFVGSCLWWCGRFKADTHGWLCGAASCTMH